MIILNCNNLNFLYGTEKILEDVSFSLQDNDKAALVGVNGAGKSTLFKLIVGELQKESGEIYLSKEKKLGYLKQNSALDTENTLWDEMVTVFSHLIEMEQSIKVLESEISKTTNSDKLESLMKEYARTTERYSYFGGYEYNSRVRGVLRGLGFSDEEFSCKVNILSGGQKTRLALAKILLEEPDVLLLDEPTNHLDIAAVEWLEGYLKDYKKCLLIISHDRYFLDCVTNKTLELEHCKCTVYNVNYSNFVKQKQVNREIEEKHYMLQQKEIARQEAYIEQQRRWNRERNIVAAESRQKALDRMVKLDRPMDDPKKIRIKFDQAIESGNEVLNARGLTKEYPGKKLFENVSFKIRKNERAFILGPNGCGKSTMLKIIADKLAATSGDVELGAKVLLGYYDQEMADLDLESTIIDEVWSVNQKLTQTEIRSALAAFLFVGEDVFKEIRVLSGGEKSRVAMLKLILSQSNFIILDEPTNHLDINSREILEEALAQYEGTLLIVSHDRYFIDKLATRIIDIGTSPVGDYRGNYTYYVAHNKSQEKMAEQQEVPSEAKQTRLASKEERSRIRRLEKQLSDTEKSIEEAENRLSQIELEMAEFATDHTKLAELLDEQTGLQSQLEDLFENWADISAQLE